MNRICLILAAFCFGLGALIPALRGGLPNWTDAGLCLVTVAYIIGTHP